METEKMNKKDPICGMEGTLPKHGYMFCSENCIKKYEKQLKGKKCSWYADKFWITFFITLAILIASYLIPFFNPVFDAFIDYLRLIWWAILLGLLLGGLIDRFIPREYIGKYLSGKSKKTILNATILGFIMSACSHGILAIAIQLHKKGASTPSVIAFLLASPWANIPITILLFGFFGAKAFLLIIAAIIIAIITGLIYQVLEHKGLIEKSPVNKVKDFSVREDIKKRWNTYRFNFSKDINGTLKGIWALNKMVTWWILIGMIMAAFARAYVPTHFFHNYMGPTFLGIVVTLFVATIIEVCSEGSSPLAFELYRQTGAFGNSFLFLLSGVITDYTEIGLIWSNIGKKSALWLPAVTIPQALLFAYLFNLLL